MRYGYIKVCAATPEIRVADVDFNTERIIEALKQSTAAGSQLTVFPELCVCGYTCGDLFNQSALIKACDGAVKKICNATEGTNTLVFVGVPIASSGKLYNCAVAICNGKILGAVPKSYLPNYGEFYEKRHFSAPDGLSGSVSVGGQTVEFSTDLIFSSRNNPEFTVAAEICEDLWAPLSPSVGHARAGANIIVNLSCSDETVGKADYRRNLVKMQSGKLICGYVYCDAGDGESTTDLVFAGHNLICENGVVLSESKPFENGLIYGEIDVEYIANERRRCSSGYFGADGERGGSHTVIGFTSDDGDLNIGRVYPRAPFVPYGDAALYERAELILNIQTKGLQKRLAHSGSETAVIGVSGGLDSALALLVTCRAFNALGKDCKDIIAVSMPAFGTTGKTKSNSEKLINAVGATAKVIPVGDTVLRHFKDIGHDEKDRNVTYENAQARMRTMVLMDIANDNKGMVIGTGDLSELALGWATYNGDHMSMYGVNCSVPKTLVKYLIAYEAEKRGGEVKKVLNSILDTEISPELLPPDENGNIAQKTEDLVGPYELHDFFLYYFVRCAFPPDKILFLACKTFKGVYDGETIKKWLKVFIKRFFAQQFKRSCVPDGVKVGSVALSPRGDWRMPSDAVCSLWLKSIE